MKVTEREESLIMMALKNHIDTLKDYIKIGKDKDLKNHYTKEIAETRILLERLENE